MRLWSVHPKYLDAKGLVALWREGLLAQAVLAGKTKGYKFHPQLERFKKTTSPSRYLATYLYIVAQEATMRGYRFDISKISAQIFRVPKKIPVTRGQLNYETRHLLAKLKIRDKERFRTLTGQRTLRPHPLFRGIHGPVEKWEKKP